MDEREQIVKTKVVESYRQNLMVNNMNWASIFLDDVSEFESVLDVGCGDGSFCLQVAENENSKNVYGIDPASIALDTTKKHDKIFYMDGFSHSIPLPDKSVDAITCCEVLEHCYEQDLHLTFKEFNRICKNKIFLTIPHHYSHEFYLNGENAHVCVQSSEWWEKLLKEYFDIYDSDYQFWDDELMPMESSGNDAPNLSSQLAFTSFISRSNLKLNIRQ